MAYSIQQLVEEAPTDVLQKIADRVCNGSLDHIRYQLAPGRRRLSALKARKFHLEAGKLGYDVPLHKLRPDIWPDEDAA